MTDCNPTQLEFSSCQGRKVQADFKGGNVSSDGGVLLLREVDQRLNLLSRAAKLFDDDRDQSKVVHTQVSQLKQRVFALAQGHEDLNDHDQLRHDILFQTAAQKTSALASAPTLCRMEHRANRHSAMRLTHLLIDLFIESYREPPTELILDCLQRLLPQLLLPTALRILRQPPTLRPPETIQYRRRPRSLGHLENTRQKTPPSLASSPHYNEVHYLIGLARNQSITRLLQPTLDQAEARFERTGQKQRLFTWLNYQAGTWDRPRLIIGKAEHTAKGSNPRYLVTNLRGTAQHLYDQVYCPRGDMENRIKEQQLDLFADRTSCHRWWPNQHRLIMSTLAYVLMDGLRRLGLKATGWASKQCGTIREKYLRKCTET